MVPTIRGFSGLVLGIVLCIAAISVADQAQTSGSISAETSNTSDAMQANWIGCAILFHGKTERCSLSGLQVPVTGSARVSGTVSNLKKLADVAGTYKVIGVDDTFGGGHLKMKNDKGVTITLWPFAASIASSIDPQTVLQVSTSGMKVELKQ